MTETSLSEVLKFVFGGVEKMLTGKKFPMNMRAMRMVAEELLRDIINKSELNSHDDFMSVLEDLASKSRTSKMWVDAFIKPVLIMMLYVRAEREGDWPLHLQAVKLMLPYFFTPRHVNYARYGVYYLRSMKDLPSNVLQHFMKGSHVMRHVPGLWNGLWSDMFIEMTFMRYGHGKSSRTELMVCGFKVFSSYLNLGKLQYAASRHNLALVSTLKKLCYGLGKGKMLKVPRKKLPMDMIGNIQADWSDVMTQATKFTAECYGQPTATSMSEARVGVWIAQIGKPGLTRVPKLASLPPMTEAFTENIKRAHLQTFLWMSPLKHDPQKLEPTDYGWVKEQNMKSLQPITIPPDVPLAPSDILQVIRCTCSSETPCKSARCGCNRANLACTVFCACQNLTACYNEQTFLC